ncbi:cysteine hydrolase family protein [candidate division KSB1 bacterium]
MKYRISSNTALILIDVQQGFDDPVWGSRNNPGAEKNIAKLLELWRNEKRPVLHVQHCSLEPDSPLRPDSPGCQFKHEAVPLEGEPVFQKTVNSAFIGTGLESYLRNNSINNLVIAGFTTDQCVSTSVRMAENLGFSVMLPEDATATFDRTGPDNKYYSAQEIHSINLVSLNDEFCEVIKTADLI